MLTGDTLANHLCVLVNPAADGSAGEHLPSVKNKKSFRTARDSLFEFNSLTKRIKNMKKKKMIFMQSREQNENTEKRILKINKNSNRKFIKRKKNSNNNSKRIQSEEMELSKFSSVYLFVSPTNNQAHC
ncbi:uncharacterized protein Tco025E_00054 [Trypanosoma conorhini]|uniref:Uncharacterized protein n=1 Tax=Trypanosoma conorhini TaxID=83891 RepID=A0A422QCG0_9TRYP|nr:uncharacterized protein Tco025E_00054 [Trypanosoma conorhini]RNF27670.1 hypothetical protein Tco025E_00054 [Trypanosoma conorhini]